jgi:hypothetical protein
MRHLLDRGELITHRSEPRLRVRRIGGGGRADTARGRAGDRA